MARSDTQRDAPRRGRADAVGHEARLAGRAAFARAGFTDPTLVLRWKDIVGRDVAAYARPLRLVESPQGGVLTLKADPAAAVFLQHESRMLCERINAYLGRDAVRRLRFVRGSLPAPPAVQKPPPPREAAAHDPVRRFQGPEGLRQALLDLARARLRMPPD